MKKYLWSLPTLALALAGRVEAQQAYQWGNLSSNDALRVVQLFKKLPYPPQFATVNLQQGPFLEPSEYELSSEYAITLSNGFSTYRVSAYTPTRFAFTNTLFISDLPAFYAIASAPNAPLPYDATVLNQHKLSLQQMQTIADAFVQSHYPDPGILKPGQAISLCSNDLNYFITSKSFCYSQKLPDGTLGPSFCNVGVDTIYGQVIRYTQAYYPSLTAPNNNTLSSAQCWQIASQSFPNHNGQYKSGGNLFINAPDSMGLESMGRGYTFTDPKDVFDIEYRAEIDATTGAIIGTDLTQGGTKDRNAPHPKSPAGISKLPPYMAQAVPGKPLPFVRDGRSAMLSAPPLQISGTTYLYVGYLTYGTEGAKINYKDSRHLAISGKNLELALDPASRNYTLNGGKKQMSAKPIFVRGHCYVPLDVAQQILPGTLRYDPKAQTVCYDSPPAAKVAAAK